MADNKQYEYPTPPRMLTIRECARTGVLSEHALRMMAKAGKLPCIEVCLQDFRLIARQLLL